MEGCSVIRKFQIIFSIEDFKVNLGNPYEKAEVWILRYIQVFPQVRLIYDLLLYNNKLDIELFVIRFKIVLQKT